MFVTLEVFLNDTAGTVEMTINSRYITWFADHMDADVCEVQVVGMPGSLHARMNASDLAALLKAD